MKHTHSVRSMIALAGLALGLIGSAHSALAQSPTPSACPGDPPIRLHQGMLAAVIIDDPNNVRSEASINADIVGKLPKGQPFAIDDGPICADGYAWYIIQSLEGQISGYTAEGKGSTYYIGPYTPPTIATAQGNTVSVDQSGVRFSFDSSVAPAVALDNLPEYKPDPDYPDQLMGVTPAAIQFILFDGTEGTVYHRSTMTVYNADDFAKLAITLGQDIADLKQTISQQTGNTDTRIPEVPEIEGDQMIRAQVKYLTLADGGKGVRFITWYASDVSLLSNENASYEFRGFSADGSHYITASFAIRTPILPDTIDYTSSGIDTMFSNDNAFPAYIDQTVKSLDAATSAQFTPNLDQLDALVQSVGFSNG